jgi:Sec-independent protein translocase protein TatA
MSLDFLADVPIELALAFVIGLLVFGPEKTMQFAVDIARWIRTARRWSVDIQSTLSGAINDVMRDTQKQTDRRGWLPPIQMGSKSRAQAPVVGNPPRSQPDTASTVLVSDGQVVPAGLVAAGVSESALRSTLADSGYTEFDGIWMVIRLENGDLQIYPTALTPPVTLPAALATSRAT